MADAIFLVDYDNVVPPRREYSALDVQANLEIICESLLGACKTMPGAPLKEVELRLYGGWISERGHHTDRGRWLTSSLGLVKGLRDGVRVMPRMVVSIAQRSGLLLVGSFRSRNGKFEQKMVDMMIGVDLLHFSADPNQRIVVASDDDDLVPAALVASTNACQTIWVLRHRSNSAGMNDVHFQTGNVTLKELPSALRRS